MSQISSVFGNLPGIGTVVETYEAAVTFGIAAQMKWWSGYISSAASDPTNTNSTWRLRPGLVLGQITASGLWTNYSATATDGSEVARAVLAYGLRMQDVVTGSNVAKFYAIIVGGNLKSAGLIGVDNMARTQMSGAFTFDTFLNEYEYPYPRFQTKTANYTVVAADNFSQFNTLGATGEVDFTLPAIANGYSFGFYNWADQVMKVISAEGSNVIALNNLTASSLAFSTGSQKIGGGLRIYSNPAGTKWVAELANAGVAAVTVA